MLENQTLADRPTGMGHFVPFAPVQPGRDQMAIDFSVVIPAYRRNDELVEGLRSVLRQNGVTVEITVVDDCPDGSAQEAVERVKDPRVIYVRNPHPTGGVPSAVRNLAWPTARGTYLHFLDDDDIVPDGLYAEVKRTFESHPKVGLIFGRIEPFGTCSEQQLRHEQRFFAKAELAARACGWFGTRLSFASRTLFDMPMLVCSAGIMRRACVERVGGFDTAITMVEDTDLFARVMREYGALFLPRVSLRYRISKVSLLHTPERTEKQTTRLREGRGRTKEKYKRAHGLFEFYALAVFARTVLRLAVYLSEPREVRRAVPVTLKQATR